MASNANISQLTATAILNAVFTLANSGTLVIVQEPLPATPETALSGDVVLGTFDIGATALSGSITYNSASSVMQGSLDITNSPVSAVADGTAIFGRLYESGGTNVIVDLIASSPWYASAAVIVGQYMTANGNLYVATAAGTTASTGTGPSGTTTGITDGTVTWSYVLTGTGALVFSNTKTATGNSLSMTSAIITSPTAG